MNTKQLLTYILFIVGTSCNMCVLADDTGFISVNKLNIILPDNFYNIESHPQKTNNIIGFLSNDNHINLSNNKKDWIKTQVNKLKPSYSITTNQDIAFGNEISFAWNLSKFLSVNLNVFENQSQSNFTQHFTPATSNQFTRFNKSFNKISARQDTIDINRNITGYKLGISSELGLGNNYKLGLNFDYGQLEGAELAGFRNDEIATTSFALGIRKAKFGASLHTDIYMEDNIDLMEHSRLGFEIDWHFSDQTTISVGSKQRINNDSYINQSDSIDNLTGNVQYIKFKHNL